MINNQPCIILVEPQLAENVGMSARAMKNCALTEMRLVNPREDHLSAKAISASSNAQEILENARVFNNLPEAVADLQYVLATTARHRDQTKKVYNADAAAVSLREKIKNGEKCGIIYGPERTGLRNEDIGLSDAIINIPLNPQHCSLNLSQAVLLTCYEFYKTQTSASIPFFETNHSSVASKEKILLFCQHLEKLSQDFIIFRDKQKREKSLLNLRNIFTRSELTEQELNTLYGIINYIAKS